MAKYNGNVNVDKPSMRSRCARCRAPLALHGATPPQMRWGDDGNVLCAGFVPPAQRSPDKETPT